MLRISSFLTKFLSDSTSAWWYLDGVGLGVLVDIGGIGELVHSRLSPLFWPATIETAPLGPTTSFTK